MGRLDGKVALISGAARGMGQAEARLFADEGAKVAVCDVIDDEGKAVAQAIGSSSLYQHLDVTDEDHWEKAVSATTEAFGKLDILINNAGIAEAAPLAEMTLDSYRRVTEVNQTGVFLGMRAAVAPMTEAGGGSIINISSIDGMVGMNNLMSYIASKWAVRGMTKAAAMELGPAGIRVNSIHPGFILTSMGGGEDIDLTFYALYHRNHIWFSCSAHLWLQGAGRPLSPGCGQRRKALRTRNVRTRGGFGLRGHGDPG